MAGTNYCAYVYRNPPDGYDITKNIWLINRAVCHIAPAFLTLPSKDTNVLESSQLTLFQTKVLVLFPYPSFNSGYFYYILRHTSPQVPGLQDSLTVVTLITCAVGDTAIPLELTRM